jgi:hypothetical protein
MLTTAKSHAEKPQYPRPHIARGAHVLLIFDREAQREDLVMKGMTAILSILATLSIPFTATRATADDDYKKICWVNENLRVLDDEADANSCRAIAVDSQSHEYQIGCRDSENEGLVILTAPFSITDKAARVTSSKLAANAQNRTTPAKLERCAKAWGSR